MTIFKNCFLVFCTLKIVLVSHGKLLYLIKCMWHVRGKVCLLLCRRSYTCILFYAVGDESFFTTLIFQVYQYIKLTAMIYNFTHRGDHFNNISSLKIQVHSVKKLQMKHEYPTQ